MKIPFVTAALLAALFVTTSPPVGTSPEKEDPPPTGGTGEELEAVPAGAEPDLDLLRPVFRPIADFFGIAPVDGTEKTISIVPREGAAAGTGSRELKVVEKSSGSSDEPFPTPHRIFDAAHRQGYSVEFLIALLADPADSYLPQGFDSTVAAIRSAHAAAGFYPDRNWFPWRGSDLEKKTYRKLPGVLLFRKAPNPKELESGVLSVVLVVGETQASGFHKAALQRALATLEAWSTADPTAKTRVRILGPIFSGTAEALARELAPRLRDGFTFDIATGSASVKEVAEILGKVGRFHRTILDDDDLLWRAYSFLKDELSWNFGKVALLNEGDSLYGKIDPTSPSAKLIRVAMPAGLAGIRTAWEEDGGESKQTEPIRELKTVLDLKLGDKSQPVDLVPEFGSLTRASKDLAIANLLANLSQSGVRYIGLHFTDPRDKLFLAERIRRYAPGMILFTLDNNLLYAHPQLSPALDGTLVFSSFPLVTESERWVVPGPDQVGSYRRQFESEIQEGTYRAALSLLGAWPPIPSLAASPWVAVVANGTLWPLARLGEAGKAVWPGRFEPVSERSHFKLTYLGAFLLALVFGLRKLAAPWRTIDDWSEGRGAQVLLFLLAGGLTSWLLGAIVVTGTLPYLPVFGQMTAMALLAAGLCGFVLHRQPGVWKAPGGWRITLLAILALTTFSLLSLPFLLRALWMPGGAELFYLRGRHFSSGLTPLLPLLVLTLGVIAGLVLETQRLALLWRRRADWPHLAGRSPYLADTRSLAKRALGPQSFFLPRKEVRATNRVGENQKESPPVSLWADFKESRFRLDRHSLFGLLGISALPMAYLLRVVQPIAERRSFGVLFVVAIALAGAFSLLSFYRFCATWRLVHRLLDALARESRLMQAFQRIAAEVRWKPMRAFGLEPPSNDILLLSAAKFDDLGSRYGFLQPSRALPLVERYFAAQANNRLRNEIEARRELHDLFSGDIGGPLFSSRNEALWDFLALRVVAFIRHLFAHLSYSLFAALVTALSLVLAVQTYAFEPKQFLSTYLWILILGSVMITLVTFLSMDRNATLSAIGGTTAGKISFDWNFFTNILTYAVVPLLGLLATQFPMATRHLVAWFNPLLKVLGSN